MTACTMVIDASCVLDWSDTSSMLGAIGSMLSACAAIVGLAYIATQLRLSRKANQDQAAQTKLSRQAAEDQAVAAKMQAKSRLLDLSNPINEIIFKNPEIYEFTYMSNSSTTPPIDSDSWKRLMLISEMQANYIEFVIHAIDLLDEDERKPWENFIYDTMNRPVFLQFWKNRKSWYDVEMRPYIYAENRSLVCEAGDLALDKITHGEPGETPS